MRWDELSSGAANLLLLVDIIKEDVEYKLGEEINFRYREEVNEQTINEVLKFQKYAINSRDKQCYSAEYSDGILKVKYLAGLE
jgi:hypothetical protein